MRRSPRFRGGTRDRVVSEDNASFLAEVIKAVDELDNSYLCIKALLRQEDLHGQAHYWKSTK